MHNNLIKAFSGNLKKVYVFILCKLRFVNILPRQH